MAFFRGGGARNFLESPLAQLAQSRFQERQRDLQAEAQRDAQRANRFATIGTLAGMGLGATLGPPAARIAAASLGGGIGGQVGRAAGGGRIQPAAVAQLGLQGAGFMNQLEQQQAQQAAAQDVSSALAPAPEIEAGTGAEFQPGPDIPGAISSLAQMPGQTGNALGLMIQRAQQQRQASQPTREVVGTPGGGSALLTLPAPGQEGQPEVQTIIPGQTDDGGAAATGQVRRSILQQAAQDRLGRPGATERPVEAGTGRRTAQPQITGQGQAAISPLIQAARLPARQLGEVPEQTFERLVESGGERPGFTERQGRATSQAARIAASDPDMTMGALTQRLRREGVDPSNVSADFWGERFGAQGRVQTLSLAEKRREGIPSGAVAQREPDGTLNIVSDFTPDSSARERKISDFMATYGMTRNEAVKMADGLARIETDPAGGTVRYIDEVSGVVREMEVQPAREGRQGRPRQQEAAQEQEQEQPRLSAAQQVIQEQKQQNPDAPATLWDAREGTTGVVPAVASVWNRLAGQVPGAPIAEGVDDRRALFANFQRPLVAALQQNDRYPEGERRAIEEAIDVQPGVLDSTPALTSRLRRLDQTLRFRLERAREISADPNRDREVRNEANRMADALANAIAMTGVPQQEGRQQGGGRGAQQQGTQGGQQELQQLLQTDTSTMSAADLKAHNDRLAELLGASQ